MKPELHSINRTAEFFSESELEKQIGHTRCDWVLAIIKELLDNSMDAIEQTNVPPEIVLNIDSTGITVVDNGPGFPPDAVEKLTDFDTRYSSRAFYRAPTRGAQGNAGKTILALSYVLNGKKGQVSILGCGVLSQITVSYDAVKQSPAVLLESREQLSDFFDSSICELPSRLPVIANSDDVNFRTSGTLIHVAIDGLLATLESHEINRYFRFATGYQLLNPHLSLIFKIGDKTQGLVRTASSMAKWRPSKPEPPHWHTPESFSNLVLASHRADCEANRDRSLRSFMKAFHGHRRNDAVNAVLERSGLPHGPVSTLIGKNGVATKPVSRLFKEMKSQVDAPGHSQIGQIGRTNCRKAFENFGANDSTFRYRNWTGACERGFPLIVEAAFAELADCTRDGLVISGVNFSPSVRNDICTEMTQALSDQLAPKWKPIIAMLHITMIDPPFADRGKSRINVDHQTALAISEVVEFVTRDWFKRQKAIERDEGKLLRKQARAERSKQQDCTLKDAILIVLHGAVEKAAGKQKGFYTARDLYYQARPLVQKYNSEYLDQKYFDRVIDEYEIEHGILKGRLRDPRGFLIEPHTGRKVPLGTSDVLDYEIPWDLYHTLIYVEKKNLVHAFEYAKVPERYDIAVIAAEGYATRAAKLLAQNAHRERGVRVLCLHDADPDGYNIARTLSQSSGAHDFDFEVIDMGLTIEEALEMGLQTETFARRKQLPSGLDLSQAALDSFAGVATEVVRKGKKHTEYRDCVRVELNALSADKDLFTEWIDRKLKQFGVAEKLIPKNETICQYVANRTDEHLRQDIAEKVESMLCVASKIDDAFRIARDSSTIENPQRVVQEWAEDCLPERWTDCCDALVEKQIASLDDVIHEAVEQVLR
ncbi:ATP-binding protein [Stieleria varia]|uniref:DNA topoisomerase VI subunit B n=1 Tax=Stieleria varia TaxID=2528005 RepID=A0A5C6B8T6_9BACT|nr:ATP-binding protein [Stieleria varia]TWU08388.1 DNA topoisomerase VI subunit B [Stieleria varia]